MFRDLERTQTVLTGIAAHRAFGASLSYKGEPMTGDGSFVSGSYFATLQLNPALGRLLSPSDDQTIGGHFVTVLSYEFWSAKFGADPGIVGQSITINGHPMEIIGVAPRGFDGTTLGSRPWVFVPITMRGTLEGDKRYENRRNYWVYLFGRLKPGVTREQATTALNALYHPIVNEVEAPLQEGMSDKTMARFKSKEVVVTPGFQGQSSAHREAKTPLMLLFGVTGIVLLIACANIANLLLARGANRATEMGVRLALGAGRRHLMIQLLTESVLLAAMGGLAGLLVARWTLHAIAAMLPSGVTTSLQFELQPSVLGFSALVSLLTGILFGMFPALHSTRSDLIGAIRAGAGQITGHRGAARFRGALVTVQIALATALLVGAGLFMKSLINVSKVDLGVKVDNVVTFGISPVRTGYDSVRSALLFERVEETFRALPGVTGVTSSLVPLLAGSNWGTDVEVQGFKSGPDIDNNARFNEVGAGYFNTLGIPLLAGREFTEADRQRTAQVAVVNEAFTRKFNLGQDAVGKFMSTRGPDSLNIQIVGVIQNAKYSEVKDEIPALFYLPWKQDNSLPFLRFYIRTSLAPEAMVRQIPPIMKQLDPGLPVEDLKTMPQQIRENIFLDRMISILSTSFAVLATLLAAVGLYGVLAYTVAQRTREIGVRMALGADATRVRLMVMRQVGTMIAVGLGIGVAGAVGLGRAASSLLYGLKGHDPFVFAAAVLLLILVALTAGYLPALRASKVHPMQALRYD
jgi:predicted permease